MKDQGQAILQLMATLTAGEKRHFRAFAQRHVLGEENQYLALFEDLLRTGEVGIPALKTQFPTAPYHRQLTYNLHYLYEMLLRSLEQQAYGSTAAVQMRSQLTQVELLVDKLQYRQAEKRLRRLQKQAADLEAFPVLLESLELERRLMKRAEGKGLWESLPVLHSRIAEVLHLQANEAGMLAFYDTLFAETQRRSQVTDEAGREHLHALLRDTRLEDPRFPLTWNGKLAQHLAHAFLRTLLGEDAAALEHYDHIITLWEAHPARLAEAPDRYAMAVIDCMNCGHRMGNYDRFPELLRRIQGLKSLRGNAAVRIRWNSANLEVLWYLNTLQLEAAVTLTAQWEHTLHTYQSRLSDASRLSFAFNICMLYFVKEDFSGALRWLNKILNYGRTPARADIRRFSRILNLIFHYELGNEDLLEYEIPATQRYLRQDGGLSGPESCMLNLLPALPRSTSRKRRDACQAALEALETLPAAETLVLGYQEMRVWLRSRVYQTRIADEVRQLST